MGCESRLWAVLLGLLCSLAGADAPAEGNVYVPYSGIIKGTEGADPVRLLVSNETSRPMICTAALAHWYSEDLGRAEPGASLDIMLWHDPETGVVNLINRTNDRMPVEAIWCGTAGDLSATRARIALPITAGPAPANVTRSCKSGPDGRFDCWGAEG